ncbi:MAG: hypothetical protein HS116_01790 [Planctomycetes bacterium]|nr:hypothetical protein [Planctomycetota bacterium]
MRISMLTLCGLVLALSAHAFEPAWLPGGEETKKAVAARKGQSELSKLALSMQPGTWAELKTEVPPGTWSSPKVNGGRNDGGSGGLHIAGWTDDAHWDSRTGQFFFMGLRQTRRFIAYSEEKNAWRTVELDPTSDNPCFRSKFGHIYSSNGFDHERSRFYHRYNGFESEKEGLKLEGGISFFDALTEKWTKLPAIPANSGFTGQSIEYFGAMDGLVILGKKAFIFSNARQKWEDLGASPVDGYHSLFRHNPYRNELLMTGGNNNLQVMARITKEGKIERLKDVPVELTVRGDKITLDPATGNYLIFGFRDDAGAKCFEFDSNANEYRAVETAIAQWPFKSSAMPVCAFIPEYGVSMWADGKVYLYKHAPAAAGGPAQTVSK